MWPPLEPEPDELFLDWLAGLRPAELARVLANRSGALDPPWPRRLHDLAQRLSTAQSVALATHELSTPAVQVLRAAQLCHALGEENGIPLTTLADRLGTSVEGLRPALDSLTALALAWADANERVQLPLTQRGHGYLDYQLGPPSAVLLPRLTVEELKRMCAAAGLRAGTRKHQLIDGLAAFFRQPGQIRELTAQAQDDTVELLHNVAWNGPAVEYWDGFNHYSPHREPANPATWAVRRGLLWDSHDGFALLPLEVGLALRGPEYRLPFTPHPPEVRSVQADPDGTAAETSAAALRLLDRLRSVLDAAAAEPLPLLKNGGIGARLVKTLTKNTGGGTDELRLAVELACGAGLLIPRELEPAPSPHGRGHRSRKPPSPPAVGLVPTETADHLRAAGSATLLHALIDEWWTLDGSPLTDLDEPAAPYAELRWLTVRLLTELGPGTGVADPRAVGDLVAWHAPTVSPSLVTPLVRGVLAEAELLGLVAGGAPGDLARALAAGDTDALTEALTALVATARSTALFGTDLTAFVGGSPDAHLAALLDQAADREAQGAATVWRFSPASVRRAFDDGVTADVLLKELDSVAQGELPQPLEYLVNDVARKHGEVGVLPVSCVVVGDNPAVLAEISTHRQLRKLRLRSLAPTVLGSAENVATTLAALRVAGFAPVERDADGAVVVRHQERAGAVPAPARVAPEVPAEPPPEAATADPLELAERLLNAPRTMPAARRENASAGRRHEDGQLSLPGNAW